MQEAEDGQAVRGTTGTSGEAFEPGAVIVAKPVESGDRRVNGGDLVGEDAGRATEGVFGGEQEVMTLVGGHLVQGASEQDGTTGVTSQFDQGGQTLLEAVDGTGGVDDEEADVQLGDGGAKSVFLTSFILLWYLLHR